MEAARVLLSRRRTTHDCSEQPQPLTCTANRGASFIGTQAHYYQPTTCKAKRSAAAALKQPNKTEQLFALLACPERARLDQLMEATGWLPHTTRAALTSFRKKGNLIERSKVDGINRYAIAAKA